MPVFLPERIEDFFALRREHPAAPIMAGGTDLLVRLRAQGGAPGTLLCLGRIAELGTITAQGDAMRIGAGATIAQLLESDVVRQSLPLLHGAAAVFASPPVRSMATIGGNICTASPAGDTLPALYVLQASVELRSPDGTRSVPIESFITGPGRTDLGKEEILTAVTVPMPAGFDIQHFEKVGQRAAQAISVVSLAALVALEKGRVRSARFAWGSVGPVILRCPEAEAFLEGKPLTLGNLGQAAEMVRGAASPIDDVRATADYRRQVAGNLLMRLAPL